jgi:MoaA/NifB/PqqE/SkfB family radical SAM enzyme
MFTDDRPATSRPAVARELTGRDEDRFLQVFMDQNNLCNLRCRMCAFSDPRVADLAKQQMPIELFEKIAREVFPHASYLTLSCLTEPLMSKDFPRRLDVLKRHPVPFAEMITNGQLLNERVIRKIIEVPLTRIGVSIDGGTAETYEHIRRRASFSRLIERLELLARLKREMGSDRPVLRLLLVLSESNLHEFDDFLALAERLEAGAVDVRTIIPIRNAPDQGTTESAFWATVRRHRRRLDEWCERTGVENVGYIRETHEEIVLHHEDGSKRICERPWSSAAIHFNGDVQICSTWQRDPVGNLARQSFEEIWHGEALAAVRREFLERQPGIDCQHCRIKNRSDDEEEDGFFKMLSKSLVPLESP